MESGGDTKSNNTDTTGFRFKSLKRDISMRGRRLAGGIRIYYSCSVYTYMSTYLAGIANSGGRDSDSPARLLEYRTNLLPLSIELYRGLNRQYLESASAD